MNGKGPPFKAGSELQFNVWFRNNFGNVAAKNFHMFYLAIQTDHRLNLREEDREYNKFLQQARRTTSSPPRVLAPGSTVFLTIPRLKPFSEKEAADVAGLKLWTYFFAMTQHTDDKGKHETEVCALYSGTGPTAVGCISHNGETF